PYAASVGILELPNLPDHGDVSDWLDAGTGTLEELLRLGSAAPTWVPPRDDDGSQPDAYVPPFLADADATALFVKGAGEDYKWVTDEQRWLEWDGRRWATVPPEKVRHHAREVIDLDVQVVNREILAINREILAINREIQDISHPQSAAIRKQLELLRSTRALLRTRLDWLGTYRSRARLDSMVALTKGDPAITVKASDLDRDRNEVCVGNGVIALRTGVVHPHDRRDLTTRMVMHDGIPARYRPLAGQDMPAAWKDFLWRIQPDPAVRDLLQLIAGAALSGTGAERRIIFMQGPGGAGKGTFMATLMAALGDQESGYAVTGDSDVLMTSRNPKDGSGHIAGIARFRGRRLVWLDETADGRTLDAGKLKHLIPGDGGKVVARDLYERGRDTVDIPACWMIVVTTNDLPTAPGADNAIWDRLLVVPFDVRIPPGERTDVSASLKSDPAVLEYVFAWAVEGAVRWHAARDASGGATSQSGLTLPERVRVATDAWRTRAETSTGAGDALADWLRSDAVMEGDYQESLADLHASHTQWAQSVRAPVLSDRAFAGALRARGIKRVRQSGGNTWNGIGLPDHRPDEDD
ncbi:MAG: phage/plasmid primase, P4 family, partial [bacterium]